MKFWLRWLADSIVVFLGLYLVDTLLHGRFKLEATWAAVLAAILLGFVNSFVRPLHRARSKPQRAVLAVVLTVLVNALLLMVFIWVGADIAAQSFIWVLLAAAFVTFLTGLVNWLIGFNRKERPRPGVRENRGPGADGSGTRARRNP